MKRSAVVIILLCLLTCGVSACGKETPEPEELIVFTQDVNEEEGYAYLIWGDRIYVPYCAAKQSDMGNLIGINADVEDEMIYEYKGYPATEWIVSYLDIKLMPSAMLCREVNATDIPEGISSEYDWNVLE